MTEKRMELFDVTGHFGCGAYARPEFAEAQDIGATGGRRLKATVYGGWRVCAGDNIVV